MRRTSKRTGAARRRLAALLALCLLLSLLGGCGKKTDADRPDNPALLPGLSNLPGPDGGEDGGRLEGKGFADPEAAMLAALSAIQSCDLAALVSCYAIESMLENYRFDDYYAWTDYQRHGTRQYLPEDDAFGRAMNAATRRAEVLADAAQPFLGAVNGCFSAGLSAANPDYTVQYAYTELYRDRDDGVQTAGIGLSDYLARLSGGEAERVFSTLRLDGGSFSITEALYAERGAKKAERQRARNLLRARAYGADELCEYGVPVVVDGCECCFNVTLLLYGERWYLLCLGSYYADVSTQIGGFSLDCKGLQDAKGSPAPQLPALGRRAALEQLGCSGAGFDSAEAAARAYLDALTRLDADAAAACYAAERIADNNLQLAGTSIWRMNREPIGGGSFLAPAARETLLQSWLWSAENNLLLLSAVLGSSIEDVEGFSVGIDRLETSRTEEYPNARAQLRALLSDARLRGALPELQVLGVQTTQNQLMLEYAQSIGASGYTGVALGFELDGQACQLCAEAACFDGRWYLMPARYSAVYNPDTTLPTLTS